MNIESINSKQELDEALKRIEELWESELDTDEGKELDLLVTIVEAYESKLLNSD